ncbi:MAG: hypothetical protein ACREBU_24710, partial [Nitrososphaera sp.]
RLLSSQDKTKRRLVNMQGREEGKSKARSDKKIRVNASFTNGVHEKLDRLAMACGTTKTELAAYLVELCLDNENIINFVQEKHKDKSRFRIIPSKVDGELKFVFLEKTKRSS